ncbi:MULTISPECIES: hypothetical protein [Brevibacterium]|nr:hypothetical protein [Brevibacterium sandarakinum]
MRDIIMAVAMGIAIGVLIPAGVESFEDGGALWILELIIFPLFALAGIVSLLLKHRKRAPAESRHPNSQEADQATNQPR